MNPGEYNIVHTKGDTFNFSFTISTDGTPWNLSTYTARFQVRASANAATTLLSLTTGSGITLNSSGKVSVTADASAMSFATGRYVYDVQLTSAGGVVTTVLGGRFVQKNEVSR